MPTRSVFRLRWNTAGSGIKADKKYVVRSVVATVQGMKQISFEGFRESVIRWTNNNQWQLYTDGKVVATNSDHWILGNTSWKDANNYTIDLKLSRVSQTS